MDSWSVDVCVRRWPIHPSKYLMPIHDPRFCWLALYFVSSVESHGLIAMNHIQSELLD